MSSPLPSTQSARIGLLVEQSHPNRQYRRGRRKTPTSLECQWPKPTTPAALTKRAVRFDRKNWSTRPQDLLAIGCILSLEDLPTRERHDASLCPSRFQDPGRRQSNRNLGASANKGHRRATPLLNDITAFGCPGDGRTGKWGKDLSR